MDIIEVGTDRLVVVYDIGPQQYMDVMDDAASRGLEGWRMLSIDTLATGFTGSMGNILLNTGGGNATEVRYTVLYELVDPVG